MKQVQFYSAQTWAQEPPEWCPIREILIRSVPNGGATENHYHDFDEYYIPVQGQADILIDGQRFMLRPGEVVALRRGSRHHLENVGGDFSYVALRDTPRGACRPGRIPVPEQRVFVPVQGRYEDGPAFEEEIPRDGSAVLQARTWFWLQQKPSWAWMTSLGLCYFPDGGDEPDYHHHECDEVYICASGRMIALVGGVDYDMHPGDIITIPAGVDHRVRYAHGDSVLAFFYGRLDGLRRYGHLEEGRDRWVL